jgi:hypothetical protein
MLSEAWERQEKMERLGGLWGAIRHSLSSPAGRIGGGNCLTIDVRARTAGGKREGTASRAVNCAELMTRSGLLNVADATAA